MIRILILAGAWIAIYAGADEVMELSASCAHTASSFNCVKYVRNYDGDTFTVNISSVHPLIGQQITVRVDGVDSPEMESKDACERQAAIRAQHETEKFLSAGRRIDLKQTKRDKYFRVLADVNVDGESLAKHLLEERLAVPYDGGHKNPVDWCRH